MGFPERLERHIRFFVCIVLGFSSLALVGCVYTTVEVDDYSSGFHSISPPFFHLELGGGFGCVTWFRSREPCWLRAGGMVSRCHVRLPSIWRISGCGVFRAPVLSAAWFRKHMQEGLLCSDWDGIGMKSMEYRVDVQKCKHVKML